MRIRIVERNIVECTGDIADVLATLMLVAHTVERVSFASLNGRAAGCWSSGDLL